MIIEHQRTEAFDQVWWGYRHRGQTGHDHKFSCPIEECGEVCTEITVLPINNDGDWGEVEPGCEHYHDVISDEHGEPIIIFRRETT